MFLCGWYRNIYKHFSLIGYGWIASHSTKSMQLNIHTLKWMRYVIKTGPRYQGYQDTE